MKCFNLIDFSFPVQEFCFYIYNSQTFFMAAFQTQSFSDLSIVPFTIQNPESVANNGGNPAEFKRTLFYRVLLTNRDLMIYLKTNKLYQFPLKLSFIYLLRKPGTLTDGASTTL